jgi:hypothetical protein
MVDNMSSTGSSSQDDDHGAHAVWLAKQQEHLVLELGQRLLPALHHLSAAELLDQLARGMSRSWPREVLAYYVAAACHSGGTWQQVGDRLGVSKQAAHKRYSPYLARYRLLLEASTAPTGPAEAARRLARTRPDPSSPA